MIPLLAGMLLALSPSSSWAARITGAVFEDANYGGGAGRSLAAAAGVARPSARVELFDSAGDFVTSGITDASGIYTFNVAANPAPYTVRVVNSTVTSARTGAAPALVPVQTYRTNAVSGIALSVTDHVGGEVPEKLDAGNATSSLAALTTVSSAPQSITAVTVAGGDVTGVDFGYSFNVIVNPNASGQGSLRQFLLNANALGNAGLAQSGRTAGIDHAIFMLPDGTARPGMNTGYASAFASGAAVISPTAAALIPTLSDPVVIDAQTQPGWAIVPLVRVDGVGAGAGATAFTVAAGALGSALRGLMVTRFSADAIVVQSGANGVTIAGNWLGTNGGGAPLGNSNDGIQLFGANAIVGGSSFVDRNVIVNNGNEGINVSGAGASGNIIRGNFIGLEPLGLGGAGNGDVGIALLAGSGGNIVGGVNLADRNIISMNFEGIEITSSGNQVQGNFIGTDFTGTFNLGQRGSDAVQIVSGGSNNTIGGLAPGAGNLIAFTKAGHHGVNIQSGTGNAILGNRIHSNTGLGIDLANNGVTLNDGVKTPGSANVLMDAPEFIAATVLGGSLTVSGYVGNAPGQAVFAGSRVEIFESDNDASGRGEGARYLGSLTAEANGNLSGTLVVAGLVGGDRITGTATDAAGNTSEFGANVVVLNRGITVSPVSGLVTTEAGGTATFTAVLTAQPTANVTIGLSSSDLTEGAVAPASLTFTAANWNAPQTVTVTGADDVVVDGAVAYTIITGPAVSADGNYNGLDATDVSAINTDNDAAGITVTPTAGLTTSEGGGTATFTVALAAQPTADVTIGLSSSDLTEGAVAPASITFTAANWNTPQTVTVTGVDDVVVDGAVAYTIVTASAVSADGNYNGLDAADVSMTNTDNDAAGITVTPTAGLTTSEAGGTATFTVALVTQPTADVTIGLSSSDLTEGAVAPTSLTFTSANWNAPQTVTVTGADDVVVDGAVAYTIVTAPASSPDLAFSGSDAADVVVTNLDNDGAGFRLRPTGLLATSESGTAASFTIALTAQPTSDVTIGLSSSDPTEGAVSPTVLIFTSLDWATAHTVTISGMDDPQMDGDINYAVVTTAAASADPAYDGLEVPDVPVTNDDDDTLSIAVAGRSGLVATPLVVLADGVSSSTLTATVRDAAGRPIQGAVVTFTSNRGAADIMSPASAFTDTGGVATARVSSRLPGLSTMTARVPSDVVTIPQRPTVRFDRGTVLQLDLLADRRSAESGQPIRYTVQLKNPTPAPMSAFGVRCALPPDFHYLPGTATVNGARVADPALGTALVLALDTLAVFVDGNGDGLAGPGEAGYAELSFQLVPGSAATLGRHDLTAVAVEVCDACPISNTGLASVDMAASELFTRSTLLGRVYEDRDQDGSLDSDEPGIAGAVVVLDDGTRVTTDANGLFTVPDLEPGPRAVKIDVGRLSPPAIPIGAATQVVQVSPGLLATVRFGVAFARDTVQVGLPRMPGLIVVTDSVQDIVHVAGNVAQEELVVNGRSVRMRHADASLTVNGVENGLRLEGDRLVTPPRFKLDLATTEHIASWQLSIRDAQGVVVRRFEGAGAPPESWAWDGRFADGTLVSGGSVYEYQASARWTDGSEVSGPRHAFGVNRRTTISFTMTGDAFVTGRAELTPAARASLSKLAAMMRRSPGEGVVIEGHTDDVGSSAANLQLSMQRAAAALSWLVDHERLPREQFRTEAWGARRPIASNATPEGRAMNRRVEIHGEGSELLRARLLDVWRGTATARVGGVDAVVDSVGRFECSVASGGRDTLEVRLADRRGGLQTLRVALPALDIDARHSLVRLPFGARGDGLRIEPRASVGGANGTLASLEASNSDSIVAHVELTGHASAGDVLELDGQALRVAPDGAFRAELALHPGENAFGVIARSGQSGLRVANVVVRVADRESDGSPALASPDQPLLELVLPAKGLPFVSPLLRLQGRTLPGLHVVVNGDTLHVDRDGAFSGDITLPEGTSTLRAEAFDDNGRRSQIEREVEVRSKRLALVALADGVVGKGSGGTLLTADAGDGVWTEGRVAYSLRGWVAGRYLVTSAYDSRRRQFRDLFRSLDPRTRDRLLSNLDSDRLYPVYGDSSTVERDGANPGRFYLGVESDVMHAAVGEFPVAFDDVELSTFHRTLYGAQARFERPASVAGAPPATTVNVFGAQNRHVPVRDEMRATGGSLYYLSHADVVEGSVQVALVVRDAGTGLVLARVQQQLGADYMVKELEGRLLFVRPVPSVWEDGALVSDTRLHGQPVSLEASYETRGAAGDHGAVGIRAHQRISPWLAVGGTWIGDDAGEGRYRVGGTDVELRPARGTKLTGELSAGDGSASRTWTSTDGGVGWSIADTSARAVGRAYKATAELDLGEWFGAPGRATTSAYFKRVDRGFAPEALTNERGLNRWGLRTALLSPRWGQWSARYDRDARNDSTSRDTGTVRGRDLLGVQWSRDTGRFGYTLGLQQRTESRTGAVSQNASSGGARVSWSPAERLHVLLDHQQSFAGPDAEQTALGFDLRVLGPLALEGRAASGSLGRSLRGGAAITATGRTAYVRQELSVGVAPRRVGTLFGMQTPLGPRSRAYTEYQWLRTAGTPQRISVMGLEQGWQPATGATLRLSGEHGDGGAANGAGRRSAIAADAGFQGSSPLRGSTRAEWRFDGGNTGQRQFLTSSDLELRLVQGWSLRGGWRMGRTRDMATASTPLRFEESRFGLSFRPRSERVVALARWTRLTDRRATNAGDSTAMENMLGVLALEGTLRLTPMFEWSAKGAARLLRASQGGLPSATTHGGLWVNRLDFRITAPVRLGVEYRNTSQRESGDRLGGWLQELTWDPKPHLRLGGGFNFSHVSGDELSRGTEDAHGWFIRAQTRY